MYDYEVIIVGGGLAGLTAAIHLSQAGLQVLVIEKEAYPRHRVCGEYVSNEVKSYLNGLGINVDMHTNIDIDTLEISTQKGDAIVQKLPLGGFGISRFSLDNILYKKAQRSGAEFLFETVKTISEHSKTITVQTSSDKTFTAKSILGAFGKRSNLDKSLNRKFIHQKSPWVGVKCHYKYPEHPTNVVGLHSFPGGYAGISKIENGQVNFCYLASYESFRKERGVVEFQKNVIATNPILAKFLQNAEPVMEKPLAIGQIAFGKKSIREGSVAMLGDSAGMIHPLCGNGMAMAIHGAKLFSECLLGEIHKQEFSMEKVILKYQKVWKSHFSKRLWMGRQLQSILLHPSLSGMALATIARSEKLLGFLVKRTHGKPILAV